MEPVPERVDRIVRAALDRSLTDGVRASGGRVAETYLLDLDGPPRRVVCKIGGPSVRTGDVIEPAVVRLVGATTGLPCPAVIASGRLRPGSGSPTRWALYEFREGDPPTPFRDVPPPAREGIVRSVGAMLGELHDTHQFSRTGALARRGDRLVIRPPAGLDVPTRGGHLARRWPGSDIPGGQPALSHGDLFPGNVLVSDSGSVSALLDWGNAHVPTAGYALARAELRFIDWFRFRDPERTRMRRALQNGYRRHRPLPPDYEAAAGLYKLLWLGQSLDRHVRNAMTRRGRRQLRQHLSSLLPTPS